MVSLDALRRIWGDILGIDPTEIGNDDEFMALGGDSVKAIQLLGEVAIYDTHVDLEIFMKAGTIQSFWETINSQADDKDNIGSPDKDAHEKERDLAIASPAFPGPTTEDITSALKHTNVGRDGILRVAPLSSVQEFFLGLALAGEIGVINYIYEVDGPDLKHGLDQLTRLLETKNPIFRTIIVRTNEQEFAQVLLAQGISSWSYPSDLRLYLDEIMVQKFQLCAPAVQYALVSGDASHEGRNFFVMSMHHTHCDAFSRYLIGKEILRVLQSPVDYARDENVQSPWFGDYVRHVSRKAMKDNVSLFWETYMYGANLANIYPLHQATISGEFDGAFEGTISAPIAHRTTGNISRNPTQVILAAWSTALAKLSGLRDIVFGLCRHGRSSDSFTDIRRVMGPLVSGLPFRISLDCDEEPATALLQRIQSEIATTSKWEHGFSPGVFPSADGRPWVQSLVDLKSELHGMANEYKAQNDDSAIQKILPRPDLSVYDMRSHWAILLSIKQHRSVFQVSMFYQISLLEPARAKSLFENFEKYVKLLSTAEVSVGSILDTN